MRSLSSLFGPSPFQPLQDHMEKAVSCAEQVPGLIEALLLGDAELLAERQKRTAELESECDAIKNGLRSQLPRRLFLPVDRRDLLEILDLQDTIADSAEDVGDLLVMRSWTIPEPMREPLRAFAQSVTTAAVGGRDVMRHLDELVESAFVGPELARTEKLIEAVQGMEDAADKLEAGLLRLLFEHEDEVGAVGVLMWLRLLETMGDVADYSKKACNRLRLMIAR